MIWRASPYHNVSFLKKTITKVWVFFRAKEYNQNNVYTFHDLVFKLFSQNKNFRTNFQINENLSLCCYIQMIKQIKMQRNFVENSTLLTTFYNHVLCQDRPNENTNILIAVDAVKIYVSNTITTCHSLFWLQKQILIQVW